MLTQGVYLPKLRLFLANTDRDNEILHFVDESFRSMLGLNVHEEEMARLASIGIDEKLAKSDHYLVIGLEYIIRIIYAGLLLALLLLCAILVWKDKLMSLASTFFICLLGFLLFGSGVNSHKSTPHDYCSANTTVHFMHTMSNENFSCPKG